MVFLYTNNELSEKESKKMIPFIIATKNKISRNKFNQGGKNLYSENYRVHKKETEKDTNKWKHNTMFINSKN